MAYFPTGVVSGFAGRTPRDIVLMSVRGDKEIISKLKKLEKKLTKKIITRAARTAMKPVMQAAKSYAPKQSGTLRKAIKLRALKKNRRGNIGVRVAISDKWFVGKMFYGAFQEFGWHLGKRENKLRINRQWHGIGSEDDTRPFRDGEHYMEQAYVTQGHGALRRFLVEVPIEIDRAIKGG